VGKASRPESAARRVSFSELLGAAAYPEIEVLIRLLACSEQNGAEGGRLEVEAVARQE
jgi:hypothetical protein